MKIEADLFIPGEIECRAAIGHGRNHRHDQGRVRWSNEVADAGPGVPEAVRDKIFEPFWSSDPSGTRSGIGLTIVSRIAERYGGDVAVVERPGGGALFTLRFPPEAVAVDELDKAVLAASVPAELRQRQHREARRGVRLHDTENLL
ncbi:MAG TPA: HAMP domain-containing sensor histidine kinase [Stellaceae bacterium]|nr:HAMP domain-containing sensor histidine kinase [Stellaceae bacterium]